MGIRVKTKIPGPNAKAWVDYYHKHAAPATYAYPFVWDLSKLADGPYVQDPDGNTFLDFYEHVGCAPLGYNHPRILHDCGVMFDPIKIADHDTYYAVGPSPTRVNRRVHWESAAAKDFPTNADLHYRLLNTAKQFGFDTAFFINSGAEAVENAVKIAQYRKWKQLQSEHSKRTLEGMFHQLGIGMNTYLDLPADYPLFGIAVEGAFHGRTMGALSHTNSKAVQKEGFAASRWVRHVPFNNHVNLVSDKSLERLVRRDELADVVAAGRIPRDLLAYVIAEPIQGEGGYRVPATGFMDSLWSAALNHEALFIADEVQSGMGRTGKWWAIEHYGIQPDLICAAKALRMGAVMGRREIFPDKPGKISSTSAGGLYEAAVGCKTLQIIEEENLLENAVLMGEYFRKRLADLKYLHPCITDVRGKGLMLAVEFATKEGRDEVEKKCFESGFLTLSCGAKALRFLPPLNVKRSHIDEGIKVLDKVLSGA